jgi:fructokinase
MTTKWMIGVDLGGTKTEMVLLDPDSNEHFRLRRPTPCHDYPGTLNAIAGLVDQAERHAGRYGLPVGVGIPGSVSRLTGRVKNGNSTWLNGQPMAEDLARLLGRPVTLSNDANCLALSEATDGAGAGHPVVFAAILGTGCGAGISVNAQPMSGPNCVAGEWGHNPLPWTPDEELNTRPCFCGRNGCNETFLSGTGMARTHRLMWGETTTTQLIVAAANEGEKRALATLQTYLDQLARGLAGVINVVDPDIVVLGGGMSNVGAIYQALPKLLRRYVFGGECDTPVVRAAHGDSSGVSGAAWLGGARL